MKSQRKELPLVEPLYSTYHSEGAATAVISSNPSIRNWYYNNILMLKCSKDFLNGYTSPKLHIENTSWEKNPYLLKYWFQLEFIYGYEHEVIRRLLDKNYYVVFMGADDYYIKGKTFYRQRHFSHDGLICGYDLNEKKYCLYSYNSDWQYKKFWTSSYGLKHAFNCMTQQEKYGLISGIKPLDDVEIQFNSSDAVKKIKEYLCSNSILKKSENEVRGIEVNEYICKYIEKILDSSIPYEKIDWRVLRVLWEHKKVMYERLLLMSKESKTNMEKICSSYQKIANRMNAARMMYASYCRKRKDSILNPIKEIISQSMEEEYILLNKII